MDERPTHDRVDALTKKNRLLLEIYAAAKEYDHAIRGESFRTRDPVILRAIDRTGDALRAAIARWEKLNG